MPHASPLSQVVALALVTTVAAAALACGTDGAFEAEPAPVAPPGPAVTTATAAPPTVSVLDAHPVLSDTKADVVVELSHEWSRSVVVNLATADDTAKGDGTGAGDYRPVQAAVSIPAGQKRVSVPVEVRTPYKALTLDTALSRRFKTRITSSDVAVARGEGIVSLAPAGMIIETPRAKSLVDAEPIPDLNGDHKADLILTGRSGKAAVLLTPHTVFEEGTHVVVDDAYLDGARAFSYEVDFGGGFWATLGAVAGDQSMARDFDGDGLSDLLVIGKGAAHILYGHGGPFHNFAAADPRLADGIEGVKLADVRFGYGADTLQVGDWDGDGALDWAQASYYSSSAGGTDRFAGYFGRAGKLSATYTSPQSFSYASGTTPVGVASLSNGANAGTTLDLNGDGVDDVVFVGIAANDGLFGGNTLYVRFGKKARETTQGTVLSGKLDGSNGFQVSNGAYPSNGSSFRAQDGGDLNGDGVADLVVVGGGSPLSIVFGKKAPFSSGSYASLSALGAEAALFDTDKVKSARCGDLNRDGIDDLVFVSENKLRVLWGKKGLAGKTIRGTQYPEMGEIDIDAAAGLDDVAAVGDLDGDGTGDIVLLSAKHGGGSGAALVVFGKTLTPVLGGPPLIK